MGLSYSFCGFRQEDFFHILPIEANVKLVTLGWGHLCPQGYYLNKLGRSPLGDATYQISRHYALWFQTRFFTFPCLSPSKIFDRGGGGGGGGGVIFGARGIT